MIIKNKFNFECMQMRFRALDATMEEICVEIQEQKGGLSTLPHLRQGISINLRVMNLRI